MPAEKAERTAQEYLAMEARTVAGAPQLVHVEGFLVVYQARWVHLVSVFQVFVDLQALLPAHPGMFS